MMRFILADRAGNKLPATDYYATQGETVDASSQHAPCWVIQERHHHDNWCWLKDIGFRAEDRRFHPTHRLLPE